MNHVVFSVRDSKSALFGQPFFSNSVGSAIRAFDDEVNRAHDGNTMFHHPEDFTLYELGVYDDHTGEFTTKLPKVLVTALDVKKGVKNA